MHLLLSLLLWSTAGLAHPFGSELYGHRLALRLDRGRVEVDYSVEISTLDHLQDLRTYLRAIPEPTAADEARYLDRVLGELETGIQLTVDGQRLPLRSLPAAPSGKGDTRFTSFHLALEAELPPGARTLNLVNGNLPFAQALYATELQVSEAVVLDACTLYELDGGRVRKDTSGRWTAEEQGRELRLSFRMRSREAEAVRRTLRRLGAGGEPSPWLEGVQQLSLREAQPLQELRRGELGPGLVLAALSGAFGLGALRGLLRRGGRGRGAALAPLLPVGLLGLPVLILLAMHRASLGLALVLAFALGLALVLGARGVVGRGRTPTEPLDRGTPVQ